MLFKNGTEQELIATIAQKDATITMLKDQIAENRKQIAEMRHQIADQESAADQEPEADQEPALDIEVFVWCDHGCGFKGNVIPNFSEDDYRWCCPQCFSFHIKPIRGDRGRPWCDQ